MNEYDIKKFAKIIVPCFVFVLIITFILIFISSPYYDALKNRRDILKTISDWQTISFSNKTEFKLPNDWVVAQNDNIFYITDKPMLENDYTIYLIGIINARRNSEEFVMLISKVYNGVAEYSHWGGHSARLSDNVFYNKYVEYVIDGSKVTVNMLNYFNYSDPESEIILIIYDDMLCDDMVNKIAQSFRRY
jgi:hypothetical protein